MTANAGLFGTKSKEVEHDDPTDNENGYLSMDEMRDEVFLDGINQGLVDLSDEELFTVMEQFALMSKEEREQAYSEVMDMLGDDDPGIVEAMKEIMKTVELMDESEEITNSLEGSKAYLMAMEDDMTDAKQFLLGVKEEIARATGIALRMISQADWEVVYNKRGDMLDSLIASGKMSPEDASLYKSNDAAWEREVRAIWDGIQNQAREHANAGNEL